MKNLSYLLLLSFLSCATHMKARMHEPHTRVTKELEKLPSNFKINSINGEGEEMDAALRSMEVPCRGSAFDLPMTIGEYFNNIFTMDLESAKKLHPDGAGIDFRLLEFDSDTSAQEAWWKIKARYTVNGVDREISTKTPFISEFDGQKACLYAALALEIAIEDNFLEFTKQLVTK